MWFPSNSGMVLSLLVSAAYTDFTLIILVIKSPNMGNQIFLINSEQKNSFGSSYKKSILNYFFSLTRSKLARTVGPLNTSTLAHICPTCVNACEYREPLLVAAINGENCSR